MLNLEKNSKLRDTSDDISHVVSKSYEHPRSDKDKQNIDAILGELRILMQEWNKDGINIVTYGGKAKGVPINWAAEYLKRELELSTRLNGKYHRYTPEYYSSMLKQAGIVKTFRPNNQRNVYYVPVELYTRR